MTYDEFNTKISELKDKLYKLETSQDNVNFEIKKLKEKYEAEKIPYHLNEVVLVRAYQGLVVGYIRQIFKREKGVRFEIGRVLDNGKLDQDSDNCLRTKAEMKDIMKLSYLIEMSNSLKNI